MNAERMQAPKNFVPEPFDYHEIVEVRVESLTNLGVGIARVDGWVVMVPFTILPARAPDLLRHRRGPARVAALALHRRVEAGVAGRHVAAGLIASVRSVAASCRDARR